MDFFAKAVAEFLAFAEAASGDPKSDVVLTVRHLKTLLAGIEPLFNQPQDCDPNAPEGIVGIRQAVIERFSTIPVQFYRVVFNPNDPESEEEPVMGWITR